METRIINIGGADPTKPRNGNNGNYDTIVAVLAGKEIARSDYYVSDFGDEDDYFVSEVEFWEEIFPIINNRAISDSAMLHDDGHISQSYKDACVYSDANPDGFYFKSVERHREAFNALPDYKHI